MRSYGYSENEPFNTYRSGHENTRSDYSHRYSSIPDRYGDDNSYYGSSFSTSDYDTNRHNPSASYTHRWDNRQGNDYGNNYGNSSNRWDNSSAYNSAYNNDRYGSSGNQGYGDRYGHHNNYDNRSSWDRAGDRLENAARNTGNRLQNTWDRWTDDNDNDRNRGHHHHDSGVRGMYGTYNSGSKYNNRNNWVNTDRDRYEHNRSNYGHHDHDNDRGWWDRTSDEVKSWFGDDDAERRRRVDERHDRLHNNDSHHNYDRPRTGGYGTYGYTSGARRDYNW